MPTKQWPLDNYLRPHIAAGKRVLIATLENTPAKLAEIRERFPNCHIKPTQGGYLVTRTK